MSNWNFTLRVSIAVWMMNSLFLNWRDFEFRGCLFWYTLLHCRNDVELEKTWNELLLYGQKCSHKNDPFQEFIPIYQNKCKEKTFRNKLFANIKNRNLNFSFKNIFLFQQKTEIDLFFREKRIWVVSRFWGFEYLKIAIKNIK